MTNLFDQRKHPLIIEIAPDNIRMIAEIFPTVNGIVFFDYGWHLEESAHPIHQVKGKITGTGPWRVGDAKIHELNQDDTQARHRAWWEWIEIIKKNYPPRERIEEIARRFGALI